MDTFCNMTARENQTEIDSYHLVKLVSMCVSFTLNTALNAPLLLVLLCSPSLLSHTHFLLLVHLLLCESIQVDLFLSTALAVDRFIAVKWPLHYEFLICPERGKATVVATWILSAVLTIVGSCIFLSTRQVSVILPRCRPVLLSTCQSGMSALEIYGIVVTAVVVPLCSLTILGCFCLLCWDLPSGLLRTRRACMTMTMQVVQTTIFSIPVVMNSYMIPGYLHSDAFDIATTIIYNLGVSLVPLVYGYRSREVQQRIRQAAHMVKAILKI
ncbi:uncharacterized protein V6R79_023606 [Siganus canaliculatus]